MWKYYANDFKPCNILRPGMKLSWQHNIISRFGKNPTFIRWVDDVCQDNCKLYRGKKELLILSSSGKEKTFHPMWFIRCRDCKYYRK